MILFRYNLLALIICALVFSSQSLAQDVEEELCKDGQYILQVSSIGIKAQRELENADKVLSEDINVVDKVGSTILVEDISSETDENSEVSRHDAERLCRKLRAEKRQAVLEARQNNTIATRLPDSCSCNGLVQQEQSNDPLSSALWGIHNVNTGGSGASSSWNRTTGSRNMVVAIVDTGIDYNHEDLAANMWTNPDEIPNNNIDDDGNGYIDDIHGINSIQPKTSRSAGDPYDDHGHGTHCAGTIGGIGNNGKGVAGVNWNVSIVATKFLPANGYGNIYDAIESLEYIEKLKKDKGVNIVVANNSWGGGGYFQALEDAIRRLNTQGIVFAAAAGNSNVNNDSSASYPANYNVPNVISVAAHDINGNRASFSNYGVNSVDISAPGVNIQSTVPGNRYDVMSGTSMATPHVSGAIALLAALRSDYNSQQLISRILSSASYFSSLSGVVAGGRALNVYTATDLPPNLAPIIAPGPTATPTNTPLPTFTPIPPPTATPTATPTPIEPFADVKGVVVNASGLPLAGVRVSVKDPETNVEYVRSTNSEGMYSILEIPTDINYVVSVSLSGYAFQPQSYPIRLRGDVSVNFSAAQDQYSLSVQILKRNKLPIANVSINAGALGIRVTDSQGIARFSAPFGSTYSLAVSDVSIPMVTNEVNGVMFGNVERVMVSYSE